MLSTLFWALLWLIQLMVIMKPQFIHYFQCSHFLNFACRNDIWLLVIMRIKNEIFDMLRLSQSYALFYVRNELNILQCAGRMFQTNFYLNTKTTTGKMLRMKIYEINYDRKEFCKCFLFFISKPSYFLTCFNTEP